VRLVAGVDVGNTTTEVVVVDADHDPPLPLAWDRAPSRGRKGSAESLLGAAALVRRLERRLGTRVELVAATPQRAVETATVAAPESAPPTGRLEIVTAQGETPGGTGFGTGAPAWASADPKVSGPVILLVPPALRFRAAVAAVEAWVAAGVDVQGVLIADDEGVVVASRLSRRLPVADQVDVETASSAALLAVEVREPGHPLQVLADPIRTSALLRLGDAERDDAVRLAAALGDTSRAVVAVYDESRTRRTAVVGEVVLRDGVRRTALDPAQLASLPVGAVSRCAPPGSGSDDLWEVDDLWAVGLREVAESVAARVDATTARAVVLAALWATESEARPDVVLELELGRPVRLFGSETAASRAGALTTPGARSASVVADLGGGTIDLVAPGGQAVVAAGGGEMLTAAVATYLGLPRGAADWVKRGPSVRIESPDLALAEDGVRTFFEREAPTGAVGSLAVAGPAGLLAFGGTLAPSAWRSLRLRLKQRVLGDNVARAARTLGGDAADLLLVGGAAGDEELLGLLRPVLPGIAVGRADVAGQLGHRYAVAYGLTLLASATDR